MDDAARRFARDITEAAQHAYRLGQDQTGWPLWQFYEEMVYQRIATALRELEAERDQARRQELHVNANADRLVKEVMRLEKERDALAERVLGLEGVRARMIGVVEAHFKTDGGPMLGAICDMGRGCNRPWDEHEPWCHVGKLLAVLSALAPDRRAENQHG